MRKVADLRRPTLDPGTSTSSWKAARNLIGIIRMNIEVATLLAAFSMDVALVYDIFGFVGLLAITRYLLKKETPK